MTTFKRPQPTMTERPALELTLVPTIQATLASYEASLKRRKLRPRAIDTYLRDLVLFTRTLGEAATPEAISVEALENHHDGRADLSASTLSKDLSVIRSYATWAIGKGYMTEDPTRFIDWPHRNEPVPRALTSQELELLEAALAAPILPRKRRTRERDIIAVLLMWYAGLRISEAAPQQWRDIDLGARTLIVRDGKGGKDRVVPLHSRLLAALEAVPVHERRGAVLKNRRGTAMDYTSLPHIFGERWLGSEDVGLEISAHQLRHTFAITLLRNRASLRSIQLLLGHKSLATTERYLALFDDDLREAIDLLP